MTSKERTDSDFIKEIKQMAEKLHQRRSEHAEDMFKAHVNAAIMEYKTKVVGEEVLADMYPVVLRGLYYSEVIRLTNSFYRNVPQSEKSKLIWDKISTNCKKSKAKPEDFIKAQFVYFEKHFGSIPKISNLVSVHSITRTIDYLATINPNNNCPKLDTTLVPKMITKIAKPDKYSLIEKQLQSMIKAQKCSREEFYLRFVISGEYHLPREFILNDPDYLSAKKLHDLAKKRNRKKGK